MSEATLCKSALTVLQVVFVHKPSGTLIATDLIWNYPGSGTPKGTQAWKFGMDRVYRPFYNNLMIKDRGVLRTFMLEMADACMSSCTTTT